MSDTYREIMVKRETPAVNKLLKGGLIGLTAVFFLLGMVTYPIVLVAALICGGVTFFVVPKLEMEFEYLYVNGELDIDVIYSKQKRKKMGSYDMQELEVLAPEKSHALDSYMNKNGVKVRDFTSGNPEAKNYILVFNKDNTQVIIKAELDDAVISDIRRIAPRKVNLY